MCLDDICCLRNPKKSLQYFAAVTFPTVLFGFCLYNYNWAIFITIILTILQAVLIFLTFYEKTQYKICYFAIGCVQILNVIWNLLVVIRIMDLRHQAYWEDSSLGLLIVYLLVFITRFTDCVMAVSSFLAFYAFFKWKTENFESEHYSLHELNLEYQTQFV